MLNHWPTTRGLLSFPVSFEEMIFARFVRSLVECEHSTAERSVNRMGIHGLSKVIGDHAPSGSKENEIKNYFGKWEIYLWLFVANRLECDYVKRADFFCKLERVDATSLVDHEILSKLNLKISLIHVDLERQRDFTVNVSLVEVLWLYKTEDPAFIPPGLLPFPS